jgi:hypothetical protein
VSHPGGLLRSSVEDMHTIGLCVPSERHAHMLDQIVAGIIAGIVSGLALYFLIRAHRRWSRSRRRPRTTPPSHPAGPAGTSQPAG